METVFTGIQPSGSFHIGNYLGSLEPYFDLAISRKDARCLIMIADLHSINKLHDRAILRKGVLHLLSTILSISADLPNVDVFLQSSVSEHAELANIFSSITPINRLFRMTQFKDLASSNRSFISSDSLSKKEHAEQDVVDDESQYSRSIDKTDAKNDHSREENYKNIPLGLLSYPVLQAADILLYKANIVPVGQDQEQHLELTRFICRLFNRVYNTNIFLEPKHLIRETVGRIMSLTDGKKKMSKSDVNDLSCIYLTDNNDAIAKKIKKAKTDSIASVYCSEDRPEISNLLRIFSSFSKISLEEAESKFVDVSCSNFKNTLTDLLIEKIDPIRKKILHYETNEHLLLEKLREGNKIAKNIATMHMEQVREVVGLIS